MADLDLTINDLLKDYNDHMPICEICKKYEIGYTTYFKILKRANITRRISSKTKKLFNVVVEKKDDIKPVYHKPVNDPNIKVVKKKPPNVKDSKEQNINKALTDAKQCIDKVKEKYVKSGGGDDDDKSDLLKAIQKSNDIRSKILNKKS